MVEKLLIIGFILCSVIFFILFSAYCWLYALKRSLYEIRNEFLENKK